MKTYSAQALPYEFDFDLEHTALLIIDMQRDFCEHGGFGEKLGNDIALTKGIIPTVKTMLEAAREKGMIRSEGKDYVVKDGDIILFRFNV